MGHFLPATLSYPDKQFIPFFGNIQVSRYVPGHPEHFPNNDLITILHLSNTHNPFLRYDEDMDGSNGGDIVKGHYLLILIAKLLGNFSITDFFKNSFLTHESGD